MPSRSSADDAAKWARQEGASFSNLMLDASRLQIRKPPKPTGKPRRLTVCLADVHVPRHDLAAWSIVEQALRDLEPDGVYAMGDLGNNASMSLNHEKDEVDAGFTYRTELAALNRVLNRVDDIATKAWDRLWLPGNHDDRTIRWILNSCPPALRDSIPTVEDACRVRERGYRVIKASQQPFKVGDLHLLHGHFYNRHHAAKHLDTLGVSCLYGHVHSPQSFATRTENGHIQATAMPCLRTLEREWVHMRNIVTWTQGFTVIEWVDGCKAFPRNVYITNGCAVYAGHVWRAKV